MMKRRRAYMERCADIMDQVALRDITKGEFLRYWCDLGGDWYDANTIYRMIREAHDETPQARYCGDGD